MDMKLYTAAISPNCRRAEATIHHLGFANRTEFIRIDIPSGETQSDAHLAINPNGKVPVLVHGDYELWESLAIMHYLAGLAGDETFMPTDNRSHAEIIRWQLWETCHFNRAVGSICWETLVKPMMALGEPDEDLIAKSEAEFRRFAKVLGGHLKDRKFLLGDNISIADFSVASHSALILNPNSHVPVGEYPAVENWLKAMEAHPAWAETAPSWG
jgi:glutathione S-transferase